MKKKNEITIHSSAAAIIAERTDADKKYMGLTTWKAGQIV